MGMRQPSLPLRRREGRHCPPPAATDTPMVVDTPAAAPAPPTGAPMGGEALPPPTGDTAAIDIARERNEKTLEDMRITTSTTDPSQPITLS